MIKLYFDKAWLPTGWADNVCITVDDVGNIAAIDIGAARTPDMQSYKGYAVPGMSNLHSHAFQRAMAGMTEIAGDSQDSFWTWRQKMYQFARAISPDQLYAIAAQLYMEMLKAGFTSVGEFHYLHHDVSGNEYSDIAEMSWPVFQASTQTGIRLTHLPVFYNVAGFGKTATSEEQARFTLSADRFVALFSRLAAQSRPIANITVGIAPHSLRAVPLDQLTHILRSTGEDIPIHIHIAEQIGEVEECQEFFGRRPVDYLLDNLNVDEHWCLVHATHMTGTEITRLADVGAVAGLCPITEANLGDGIFPAQSFMHQQGSIGIGSDSNIRVSVAEELRLLEYTQRLSSHRRNVLAEAGGSTAERLFTAALAGGARALGRKKGAGLKIGISADIVVLNSDHEAMVGKADSNLMDSWIFAGDNSVVKDVFIGGVALVTDGVHSQNEIISRNFRAAMMSLRQI